VHTDLPVADGKCCNELQQRRMFGIDTVVTTLPVTESGGNMQKAAMFALLYLRSRIGYARKLKKSATHSNLSCQSRFTVRISLRRKAMQSVIRLRSFQESRRATIVVRTNL
jgi:hypothetical protein